MDVVEAKRRLDEIEQMGADPTVDAGALQIMEELAETSTGLRWLVEHYSKSPSANIVGYLALVLGKRSSHSTDATAPLVFRFADELQRRDYEAALVSALGAMNNQISFGAGWGASRHPPYPLFRFVKHCLEFAGKHHVLVQFAAVDLLTTICLRCLLTTAFDRTELEWISSRVQELSQTDEILLGDQIQEFRKCHGSR
jgi:hypothetical protein